MFDLIRNHQRVLLFLLVLLIFPAFALFGISGYDRMFSGDSNTVARVGELAISTTEFNNAREQQFRNMRRMLGEQFDESMLDTPDARNEILEQLISQRVLAVAAQEKFVVVPDTAVRNTINEIPAFRNDDGQFDLEQYRRLLAAQGQSELGFENRIRADLAIQSVPRSVSQTGIMPRTVSRRLVSLNQQKRQFRSRTFESASYIEKAEVDGTAARAFYDENPDLFKSPESMHIEYLVVSQDELLKTIEVSDEQVSEYYKQNAAAYVQPEQRRARHILLTVADDADEQGKQQVLDKANELVAQLRGGADFAELARTESDDSGSADQGGDLGYFDLQTMQGEFADAAFDLALNDISDPVQTPDGLHIIQVTEIREKEQKSLEKARPDILQELTRAAAAQAYADASAELGDTAYEQPDSLAPAAEKLGMEVQVLEQYQRFGTPGLDPQSPLNNPRVVRMLFAPEAIESKKNSEAIEVSDGVMVAARVIEHRPSRLQEFSEVEADATSRVRARDAARLAKEAGEATLARLKAGEEPEGFDEARTVDRYSSGLPRSASEALFAAQATGLPSFIGVDLGQRGYMIQQLMAVEEASEEDISKALDSFTAQAASLDGQAASRGLMEALKQSVAIERFPDRILAVAGAGDN